MPLPFADFLVGIIRVPITNLIFANPSLDQTARSEDSRNIIKLLKVFRETGLNPSEPANQIFGIISPANLQKVILCSRLSKDSLSRTILDDDFPMVRGSFQILCAEGRCRIEAAQLLLGRDAWWTIKLHCIRKCESKTLSQRYYNINLTIN